MGISVLLLGILRFTIDRCTWLFIFFLMTEKKEGREGLCLMGTDLVRGVLDNGIASLDVLGSHGG
jgi:hypothetical protein